MYKRVFVAALVFGAAALAPPVWAQTPTPCLPRPDMTAALEKVYGEQQQGVGLQDGTHMIELWASEATGTFTVLVTMPNGISCILLAGAHWQAAIPMTANGLTY